MATQEIIKKNMLIGELVSKYPNSVEILLKYGLHCVGCHVSAQESIEQGCKGHGMTDEEINEMIEELNEMVENEIQEDFGEEMRNNNEDEEEE